MTGEDRGADLAKGEGIPGVIIEHCYIIGQDTQYLDSESDIQKLAKADCDAFVEYYNLEKKDSSRVSSVSIDKTNATLMVDEKLKLTATVSPETAKNKNVKWDSSNSKVAIVSDSGEVTAVGTGNCTITVTTEDRSKTATANITVKDVSISLDKKETNILVGEKIEIYYEITPESVINKEVTWKSDNPEIATVDENGIVTAIKKGTCTITATSKTGNKTASVKVNINELGKEQKIKVNNLKQENDKLSKIQEKTLPSTFKKNFEISEDLEIIVKNAKEEVLKDTEYIGTGTLIQIREKESKKVLQDYECLMYADVDGDGQITASDYVLIKNHIMETKKLNNKIKEKASDVYADKQITASDYVLIKNHIMEIKKLELK